MKDQFLLERLIEAEDWPSENVRDAEKEGVYSHTGSCSSLIGSVRGYISTVAGARVLYYTCISIETNRSNQRVWIYIVYYNLAEDEKRERERERERERGREKYGARISVIQLYTIHPNSLASPLESERRANKDNL